MATTTKRTKAELALILGELASAAAATSELQGVDRHYIEGVYQALALAEQLADGRLDYASDAQLAALLLRASTFEGAMGDEQ